MATALQIIERAMRTCGILAESESASGQMAADGLILLNDVIAGLSNENLMIYANTTESLTLTGAASYTWGTGGNINSSRPMSLDNAYFTDTTGYDYPVSVITQHEWDAITDKDETGDYVLYAYLNPTYSTATLYTWPLVSSGTLKLVSLKPLSSLATQGTSVSLPLGYDRLLRYALADELVIEYGVSDQMKVAKIQQVLKDAKTAIKRINNKPRVMRTSMPFGGRFFSPDITSDGS
jgi:hypothetical protein